MFLTSHHKIIKNVRTLIYTYNCSSRNQFFAFADDIYFEKLLNMIKIELSDMNDTYPFLAK